MNKTLILIDGHALAFRQYYALERSGMKNSEQQPTWAVYGFFKAIFDLLKKIRPTSIAVAFDVARHTFRVDKYPEYKANREAMPDSLRSQLTLIFEGLKAFNIPIYTKEGFEADDVIGTISTRASQKGYRVLILTGDQDSFQLIDKEGSISVLIPTKGELIEYNWDLVFGKLGVYPDQVVDYKALRGDTSDNIPGIKGIGEKTAQKLLHRYYHLEELLEDCDNIPENSIRNKVCEGRDIAILSKELATIIKDVDINFDYENAKVDLPDLQTSTDFLRKMQFYTFIKNIDEILSSFSLDYEPINNVEQADVIVPQAGDDNGQLGLFATAVKDTFDKSEFEQVPFDIALIEKQSAIAILPKENGYYIAYDENKTTFTSDVTLIKRILNNSNMKKAFYDLKAVYKNFEIINNIGVDVLLASYVREPNRKHSIDAQALDFIEHMVDSKNAYDEVYSVYQLANYWESNLDEKEKNLLYEIEQPLSKVLATMEKNGVAIDVNYLKILTAEMDEIIFEAEEMIYQIAGERFNINSPKQVAEILFDKLGIKSKKKKRSTGAEILEELAEENEICQYILEYRKFAKLKSTYTESLPLLVSRVDGRIHTTYGQTGTVTGRLTSANPNLQNIPIRTEEGNKIRNAFCAQDKENYLILSADYSQIELRLLAHICGDEHLIEAFISGEDIHSATASKVFDVPVSEVTKEMRNKAKAVNFGIIYGQTKYGLAKSLGISVQEAGEFIDKYFATYPKVKSYMEKTIETVQLNGFVETLYGRKRYLETELNSPNFQIREFAQRAAINQPIQGTAADLIKMAMIDIDKKIVGLNAKMIMQVHDELVFEVAKDELEQVTAIVKEGMELNQPFSVPLEVDINCGESWKE